MPMYVPTEILVIVAAYGLWLVAACYRRGRQIQCLRAELSRMSAWAAQTVTTIKRDCERGMPNVPSSVARAPEQWGHHVAAQIARLSAVGLTPACSADVHAERTPRRLQAAPPAYTVMPPAA
jgi:hypothetical protein